MTRNLIASALQIAELRSRIKCSLHEATRALAVRDGILEFALEYLQSRDLPGAMSPEERYPKWSQFLQQTKGDKK